MRFRNTGYSVDPRYLGAPATLLVHERRIVIEVGASRCEHLREDGSGEVRRLSEHSLAMAARITAERKQTYFKRQCLLELGPQAQQFLDRLIMRSPGNAWYADKVSNKMYGGILLTALERGAHDCLVVLLQAGFPINAKDGPTGRTLLHQLVKQPFWHGECLNSNQYQVI